MRLYAVIVNSLFHTLFVTIPSRVRNIENLLQSLSKAAQWIIWDHEYIINKAVHDQSEK